VSSRDRNNGSTLARHSGSGLTDFGGAWSFYKQRGGNGYGTHNCNCYHYVRASDAVVLDYRNSGIFTYFCLNKMGKTRKEQRVAFNPQLGLTMADGGDPIEEETKE